jgi:hypothetical protein
MKNNGRKIFFAILMAAIASLPTIVMAVNQAGRK